MIREIKGLMVMDIRLLWRKYTWIGLFAFLFAAAAYTFFCGSPGGQNSSGFVFIVGYSCVYMTMLVYSTVDWDIRENGGAFFFTLPISRSAYVVQKYILALCLPLCTTVIVAAVIAAGGALYHVWAFSDVFSCVLMCVPMCLLMDAFVLPLYMKKANLGGILVCIVLIPVMFLLGGISSGFDRVYGGDAAYAAVADMVFAVSVLLWLLSMRISIRIMQKREL